MDVRARRELRLQRRTPLAARRAERRAHGAPLQALLELDEPAHDGRERMPRIARHLSVAAGRGALFAKTLCRTSRGLLHGLAPGEPFDEAFRLDRANKVVEGEHKDGYILHRGAVAFSRGAQDQRREREQRRWPARDARSGGRSPPLPLPAGAV